MVMIWILAIIRMNVVLINILDLNPDVKFLGKERLKRIQKEGIKKKLMGVKINTKSISLSKSLPISFNKKVIGELRSGAYSPKFDKVVGIAMIQKELL